jgi:4'-phosphopantetheinyl transferase
VTRHLEPESGTVYAWVVPAGQRQRRPLARALLLDAGARLLAAPAAQVMFSQNRLGRPMVTAGAEQLWTSVSYGAGVLAVAASLAGPVGIDIEAQRPAAVAELAGRWFDPAEASWLEQLPAADQLSSFLLLWTAKEALGKALGAGLAGAGLRRRVPLPPVTGTVLRPVAENLSLAQPTLAAQFVLAIAAERGSAAQYTIALVDRSAHEMPARSTARSRTSLPVVVRGS